MVIGWALGFFLVGLGALNLRSQGTDATGAARADEPGTDHAAAYPGRADAQAIDVDGAPAVVGASVRSIAIAMVLPYVPVGFGLVVTVAYVVRDGALDRMLYLLGVAVMVLVVARQFRRATGTTRS